MAPLGSGVGLAGGVGIGVGMRVGDGVGFSVVGMFAGDDPKELLRVVNLADDVEARAFEQARCPLPQEHRVVGDYDAHG